MPSRKPPSLACASSAASPAAERMSLEEARSVLMDLWSRKQVDAAKASNETERAERRREVKALSVALSALEVLRD